LAFAVFFCPVSWYAVLDATQFVDDDSGRLVAYRGHPSYSLPGYPRSIWSYAYGPKRLAAGESRRLPIVAPLGKPVAPLLEARLDPLVALSQKIAAGEFTSALQSAQMLLERRDLPFETQLGARYF
jgi:hypothetical protein